MAHAYKEQVMNALRKNDLERNPMALPQLEKIVLHVGVGKMRANPEQLEEVSKTLTLVSGQKPITTKARKAIAGFKVRQGEIVGYMVTMRGNRMWDFLQKLVQIALPRVRDFRPLPQSSFDKQGNLTIALTEQTVFPEIAADQLRHLHGLSVTIKTTAHTPSDALLFTKALGLPFKRE